MGLFNNLRHRIVEKLIRSEDGYTFTGFMEDEPIEFCQDYDTKKYLFSRMRSGKWIYFEPTLSGWKEYECDPGYVMRMDFQLWMCGILDDIHKQYMDRLHNLTQREIRKLRKAEEGNTLMINKESFCDMMAALDKYWKDLGALEDLLNVVFEGNVLTEVFDAMVDALCEDLEPDREFGENPVIWDWLFEMDAGRNEKAKKGLDGHPLTSAEELYDYLVWKRDDKLVPPVGTAGEDA